MMKNARWILFACFAFAGCASLSTTSTPNFNVSGIKQIPRVVGVAYFNGEEPYATNARRDFYNALRDSHLFDRVYNTDDLREAMDWSTKNFLAPEVRKRLHEKLGLQGVFTAQISSFKNIVAGNAHIYMDLIDTQSDNTFWSCHAQDDRIISESASKDETTTRAIQNAYKKLKEDIVAEIGR